MSYEVTMILRWSLILWVFLLPENNIFNWEIDICEDYNSYVGQRFSFWWMAGCVWASQLWKDPVQILTASSFVWQCVTESMLIFLRKNCRILRKLYSRSVTCQVRTCQVSDMSVPNWHPIQGNECEIWLPICMSPI